MRIKLLTLTLLLSLGVSHSQKFYSTTGGELIFSLADVEYSSSKAHDVLRFAPVVNFYKYWHYDINSHAGFLFGIGTHNIGFITEVPRIDVENPSNDPYIGEVRKRFRNYTLGIPIGFKIGVMDKMFLYGGYEIEFPYVYKEKTYEDNERVSKYTKWFADQAPTFYNSFFVGMQMPRGISLKFHYYLTDFFDQDYVQNFQHTNSQKDYPTKANVFYFSLTKSLFRNRKFMYYDKEEKSLIGRTAMR
jgi:hypothetical protein